MPMDALFSVLTVFVLGIFAVAIAGLVAGFSPTLYIAQAAIVSRSTKKGARRYTYLLMAGVLSAVLLLLIFFQTISLATLTTFIDSSVRALTVSVASNAFVALLFIGFGVFYVRTSEQAESLTLRPSKSDKKPKKSKVAKAKEAGTLSAAYGLGVGKTFINISGVTAVYVAGNIISSASATILDRLIFTVVFLVATVGPFLWVLYVIDHQPKRLKNIVENIKGRLTKVNYRLTVGIGAILFGVGVLVYNVMMALFY